MRDEHIISLLEKGPVARLDENELTAIGAHTARCSNCLRAFEAAQVSSMLLKEGAAESFEPPPFFHTTVLANLRERQAATAGVWAWSRVWRSAGALASSMVATVAALAVFTFVIPGSEGVSGPPVSPLTNIYSAEEVILDQGAQAEEQLSDDLLLTTIYGGEED